MAIDAGVPIIPLIVWGAQRIVTKGGPKNLGRNHFPISVEVGAPIDPVEPAEALSEILRIEMDAILRHVQDGSCTSPGVLGASSTRRWRTDAGGSCGHGRTGTREAGALNRRRLR